MSFLHNQIEEIDSYSDKSLFFQNPQIFEGWLALVRAIEKIETWEAAEDKTKWEERTETYVAYLLTLRDYYFKYQNLYQRYYEQLSKTLSCYGDWLMGDCISADGIEALSTDKYYDDVGNVDDIVQHLTKLNDDSLKARSAVHSVLMGVMSILMPVMNRGALTITGINPSIEDFAKAIDDDLREWTLSFGKSMFREMKEDLNRHFKDYRTAPYTPELWGQLLGADEDALKMAKRHELASCEDVKQEHWGEDMKAQMDENGKLMQYIYSSCRTEEHFDLRMVDDIQSFISLLTPDNLSMFYDIIVRRNLIQCEMFPELKTQHEEWLNKSEELPESEGSEEQTYSIEPPKINLQRLLKQEWFAKFRTKEEYNEGWTDAFIDALMVSEWGEQIARDWTVKDKRLSLKCMIVGVLMDAGVLRGSYSQIAKLLNMDGENADTLAKYLGLGKKQAYADWIAEYTNPALSD